MDERGLAEILQTARKAAGLTQQELCAKANLSFSTLTKIERGAIKSPSIFTVLTIAQTLGVGLDELLGNKVTSTRNLVKTKSGVSFIYFDINGSLVHFFQQAFTRIAEDYNVPADVVESGFWHYNDEVCKGTVSLEEFNAAMNDRLRVTGFDWAKYYLSAVEPIEPLQELLIWASERYRVGILSNIMPGFIDAMIKSGVLPNLPYDAIVDSSELGTVKPEPKIFEVATDLAAVPPEEILLIDDTRSNLVAAEKLGWKVLIFDDYQIDDSIEKLRVALAPAE
jgi:FMN phosphatase YigB (HAD superfamily)/DNA-binding XRE family transcriptional regulator